MVEYELVELDQRVPNIDPVLVTRFFWRAERRMHRENERRLVQFYRWEIHKKDGKWHVVAMQNALRQKEER